MASDPPDAFGLTTQIVMQLENETVYWSAEPPPYSDLPPSYQSNPPPYSPPVQTSSFTTPPYRQNPPYTTSLRPASCVDPPSVHHTSRSQVIIVRSHPSPVGQLSSDNRKLMDSIQNAMYSSLFVFLLCGFIFGAIAFILAWKALSYAKAGDSRRAHRLDAASSCLSCFGIITGGLVIGLTLGLMLQSGQIGNKSQKKH